MCLHGLLVFSLAVLRLFSGGCGRHEEKSASGSNIGKKNVLRLVNWNNYIASETVDRFEEGCKCDLSQDYYADNEEMLAKLAAGATGYDVIVPTGNAIDTLIRQGALTPLDKTLLPNFKNINPAYLDTTFDPENKYSVPYAYTLTLLGFNQEKIEKL